MAMNKQRRTSNINNIVTYDTVGNVTLPANITISGLQQAGFVKTDASGLFSVDNAAYVTLIAPLAGYTVGAATPISSTDTILQAFGKLQGQLDAIPDSGLITGSGASGQITYWTAAAAQSGSNNLFWDTANSRLGVGTNVPLQKIDVSGAIRINGAASTGFAYINSNIDSFVQFQNSTVDKWRIGNAFLSGANYFQIYDNASSLERLRWDNTGAATFSGDFTFISSTTNNVAKFRATEPNVIIESTGASNPASLSFNPSANFGSVIQTSNTGGFLELRTGGNISLRLNNNNTVSIPNLGGSGAQMVVTDNNGLLSKQAIPSATIAGTIASGQVAYGTAANTIGGSNDLYWYTGIGVQSALCIGTTTPQATPANTYNLFIAYRSSSSQTTAISVVNGSTNVGNSKASILFQNAYTFGPTYTNSAVSGVHTDSSGNSALLFETSTTGTLSEKARFDSVGRLLINRQVSSTYYLDVNGTARIDGDILVNGLNIGRGGGNISGNTAVGGAALTSNTTGSTNVAIGLDALKFSTSGSGNIALGYRAGAFGVSNTSGSYNIFIGYETAAELGSESNRTFIGSSTTTSTWLGGNLLLGARIDTGYRLNVTGTAIISGAVTLSNLAGSGTRAVVADSSGVLSTQSLSGYITSLTGEATSSGGGATTVTLTNSAVIGKVLTGLNVSGSAITSSDTILTAFGKVQSQINALQGGTVYKGAWNANTNTPTITSSTGTQGHYYVVTVAGSTTIDGISSWAVGDWIIYNGTVWEKIPNVDSVTSVNGQTGIVSLTTTNINEGTNLYYTDTRARAAITLTTSGNSGAATYSSGALNIPNYTLAGLGGASSSTTITINGIAFDISANRIWSVGSVTSIATTGPITGGTITSSGTIGITQATTSTDGYLSSTDWNTFNNKGSVSSITASGPLTGGTITTSGTIGIAQSTTSTDGYLSSTDWNTFNSRMSNPMSALGDIIYGNASGAPLRRAGNTTTTKMFLSSTGDGTNAAAPVWEAITTTTLGAVPTSRTITINGTSFDLSANRTFNVGTVTSVGISAPTGFSVANSPVTGAGTLALSFSAGYSLPTTASQTNWDAAYNDKINSAAVTGTSTKTLTLTQQDGGTITATWADINTDAVTSVFGRTGAVVAVNGDYTTAQVTESGNLYYTDARARAAISLTTTGTSGAATYSSGVLNIPQYQSVLTNPVTGTGTTGQLARFTGSTAVGNSIVSDNGTNVVSVGEGGSNGEYTIKIGQSRSGNGYAYIDLIGDTTYTGYGARFIRGNGGANTFSTIEHRGTGNLTIKTVDNGHLYIETSSVQRAFFEATFGTLSIANTSGTFAANSGEQLIVNGPTKITGGATIATSSGEVLIGTTTDSGDYKLQVNGNVYATAYYESSDIRLKDVLEYNPNINPNIDVIKFKKKGQDGIRYGYSAQQVYDAMPELTQGYNHLSVNYLDVHTLKIAALEREIAELKKRLN